MRESRRRRSIDRFWWRTFLLITVLGALWVLATPVFASPDEPSQVIRSWSAAHGELFGHPADRVYRRVTAPAVYKNGAGVECIAFDSLNTANCLSLETGSRTTQVLTYHARFFPAYYLVVGIPTLFSTPGAGQIHLMRFVSVLLASALLASAFATARSARERPLAVAGLLVALTPSVLFLAASVNPSGLEIAAAIGVWASGALLAMRSAHGIIDARLVDRLGIAAIALAVTRPIGPFWLALAGLILFLVGGLASVRSLWRSRRCRWWSLAIAIATAIHLSWNFWAQAYDARHYLGTPPPGDLSTSAILRESVGKSYRLLHDMIGVFGWNDIPAPALTLVLWLLVLGAVVGLALLFASRRWTLAIGVAIGCTALLPVLLEAIQVRDIGFQWQGRYTLPIAVAVPVLAGFGISDRAVLQFSRRRLSFLFLAGLTVAQVAAFWQPLRSYSVGANGPVWFFPQSVWEPPVPGALLLAGYAVALVAFIANVVLPGRRAFANISDTEEIAVRSGRTSGPG